jgi:1-acyl-sn-glycerol-3-phosphate acyltransferase
VPFRRFFESPRPLEFLGKDPEYWLLRGFTHACLDWMRDYTHLDTEGLENIPSHGGALIIPNHSGVMGWDAFVIQNEILKAGHRIPRTMSHNFWHQSPLFKRWSFKLGYFPQDFKMAVRILRKNKVMLLFPEAEAGNFKPSTQMYQLQPFNPGFISLSIITGKPIVPACIIGAEETHLNLGTMDWTEKYIGAKVPIPLNLIPLPVQWKIIFLKPVSLEKYGKREAKNIRFLEEAAGNIRMRIQNRIHKELVHRGVFKFYQDG